MKHILIGLSRIVSLLVALAGFGRSAQRYADPTMID
jgi:hypothetical protein